MKIKGDKYIDIALLIIRIGLGLSYIVVHGWGKITGGVPRWESLGKAVSYFGITFVPVFWGFMAAISEVLGGLLILLGLFFRPAVLLLIITMFTAANQHLQKGDPLSKIAYPLELAFVLAGLLITGPGKYGLHRLIKRT